MPVMALAHGKWLVPEYEEVIAAQHGTYAFYSFSSGAVWVWGVVILGAVLCAAYLHRVLPSWRALDRFAQSYTTYIDQLAQVTLGVFLVVTAYFWNVIILPNETVTSPLLVTLQCAQIVIGLLFIGHIASRYAAIGLLILSAVVTIAGGLEAVLENVILYTLALYFYVMHTPRLHGVWAYIRAHSVDMVRIGTGVSLIALACTEKLLYPELGMQFLAEHHWNFMQPLFPLFSDQLFVLSTGFAEMLFGIVFILGYVPRITTAVISLFFLASVTTMLYQAQVWEVEDFVVYTAAIIVFFFANKGHTVGELVRRIRG